MRRLEDPIEAFARHTHRRRRWAAAKLAASLTGIGGAFFSFGVSLTDAAHFRTFMGAAAASLLGAGVAIYAFVRGRRSRLRKA